MFFTRQRITTGQQALDARSLLLMSLVSGTEQNWSPAAICPRSVGSRSRQCGLPGLAIVGQNGGSKPCAIPLAQIVFSMKNARNESGIAASDKTRVSSPDDQVLVEHPLFSEIPSPRTPESPDVESLRSLLKANLPRETASPALLQRIRSRMQAHKD